ncbi:hypothetical protein VTK26DRAFT_2311 [Humicola hyalothermophila]
MSILLSLLGRPSFGREGSAGEANGGFGLWKHRIAGQHSLAKAMQSQQTDDRGKKGLSVCAKETPAGLGRSFRAVLAPSRFGKYSMSSARPCSLNKLNTALEYQSSMYGVNILPETTKIETT